jgi:hypothetical protein
MFSYLNTYVDDLASAASRTRSMSDAFQSRLFLVVFVSDTTRARFDFGMASRGDQSDNGAIVSFQCRVRRGAASACAATVAVVDADSGKWRRRRSSVSVSVFEVLL